MQLIKITVLLFIVASVAGCGDAKKPPAAAVSREPVKVTLRAVGAQTAAAAITASVPDGKLATPQERALPWEASFTVPRGTPALVKVDNNSREGSVKCQILVDGRVVKEVESGPNVISATCLVPAI